MAERNLAIRLSVMDGGKVKAELKEIGESGEKSLKKIELAGKPASKSLIALNAAANDMKGAAIGLSTRMGPLGAGLVALGPAGLAAAAALAALTLGFKAALTATMAEEQAQNRLQGVLKATGYAAGFTKSEIVAMAEDMEKSTMASSEEVEGAAAIMATFRSVAGDTFKRSIRLAQDMSAVFGQDLRSSVTQLGKALEDPIRGITALRRVGVSFSESQQEVIAKMLETGDLAKAQGLILDALAKQVGGAGKAETQGLTGAAHRLSVAWDDMLKTIGKTETVGGTAETVLNKLALAFGHVTEAAAKAPLDEQLSKARVELDQIEKKLVRIRDIPAILQPRGNVAKNEARADTLRSQIKSLEGAIKAEKEEQRKAEEGKKAAEKERVYDLIDQRTKPYTETVEKFLEKDPAYRIAKLNKELEQSVTFLEGFRTADNGADIDKAIGTTRKAMAIKIDDIQNPIAEAAEKEAAANQKVVDDLKQKLLGLTDERKAFIDEAVSRLSDKATAAQRDQTAHIAGQFFDEKAFAEGQKVVDGLNDKIKALGMTARQLSIKEALAALPATASPALIAQVEKLTGVLYDEEKAKERLDKLTQDGKELTDQSRTATEAYADQIARLTELLNGGAISQEVFNKAKDKAYNEQLAGRTDAQAGAIRAFRAYQKEGENTAEAVEKAFSEAMKATEDSIVNMVTSGEISLNSLNDLANSIVADITRMVVQQSITGPLAKWMGSSMESGGFLDSVMNALSFHEGGIVGETSAHLSVPSYVFAGAPRYHGGGIAGLKPDEVPAILQRGEEVVSRKNRQRRSSGINVVMNISTPDANSFRASQGQIAAQAARGINKAKRNL